MALLFLTMHVANCIFRLGRCYGDAASFFRLAILCEQRLYTVRLSFNYLNQITQTKYRIMGFKLYLQGHEHSGDLLSGK